MMEKNYQPDGWLGLVIATELYFEFTDEEKFDDSMIKLMREIGERGKTGVEMIAPSDVVDIGGKLHDLSCQLKNMLLICFHLSKVLLRINLTWHNVTFAEDHILVNTLI